MPEAWAGSRRSNCPSSRRTVTPEGSDATTVMRAPGTRPASSHARSGHVERVKGTADNIGAGAVSSRNRIAVRVTARVAEDSIEAIKEPVGDRVFEYLGFFVHFIPGKTEGLVQVGFKQAVTAHHPQRDRAPLRGQSHASVALVRDEALAGQALNVLRRRRRDDAHVFGDILGFDAVATSLLGAPYELEDVLHDRGMGTRRVRHGVPLSSQAPL